MTQAKDTNPKDALAGEKVPLDLVPMTAIALGALGHLDGATKYGRWNWRATGVRASVYVGALKRHIAAWENGEEDASDGVPHLGHAHACLNILIDAQACGVLTDDRPPRMDFSGWLAKKVTPWVKRIRERYRDCDVPKHYTIAESTLGVGSRIDQPCWWKFQRIEDPTTAPRDDSKTIETCRQKFDNLLNFKGSPEILKRCRVYLAGPMRGIPDHNFPEFNSAAAYLRSAGYEVVSPAEHDVNVGFNPATGDGDAQFKKSIGWDIEQILACDAIVLLDGWRQSRGACLEAAVAYHAGKKVLRLSHEFATNGPGTWGEPFEILLEDPVVVHGGPDQTATNQVAR